jgi:hypothetical protein
MSASNRISSIASIAVVAAVALALSAARRVDAQTARATGHDHAQAGAKVVQLPRDLEVRLAENALPKELRAGATVLVMEAEGYVKVRQGTNPFTCLVSRRGGNFYPVCFDEEGTRTILPEFADDAVLRSKGASDEEVRRHIAQGFEEGRYRPPSRPGVAYMLSPATYMLEGGKLTRGFPHTMFYAPFLTNTDIGGIVGRTAFVDRPGPHGMIIVLAGQREREALAVESQGLVDEVERAIGLK